ncbi:MAG: orotidine 5'-phosphate decarboxylase [Candidatus Doudnabacteria bacterium RIFCSPHIGHO2_01_FULL_43_23]|uniref:Orotidine 5'-phosphate decarboxylase n=1 Tax=Candidatus Doudnabacteria bacterium RIFCSPHIGHO2_01_FULL_43_23 TaxID=1817822 RepID=A0A1F5NUJ8_9BACT|nr:MAG: orotidine 5'-phosphate decarboxylase [Candidatus Doudnabacteria bacterium RIFCSPHIGHO2_01_FULL_43_23]
MKYADRAKLTSNPTAKRLLILMDEKRTNLCCAADFIEKQQLLEFADLVGPEICVLKTHIDIVEDFDQDLLDQLIELSKKHNFLFFEDRKFADIGNTVKHQYADGIFHIANWAHIVNAHSIPGPGIIEGLKEVGLPKGNGLLLLAEMSSKDNLATSEYTKTTVEWAKQHDDFVIGFIAMKKITDDSKFLHLTPGVKISGGTDDLNQQYLAPEKVISTGSDVIIVGRGIYTAKDPLSEAKTYRKLAWNAYQNR